MGCGKSKTAAASEETKNEDEGAKSEAKLIVVFGATGNQGGSVVSAMKDDKTFTLRAVTRDPDSDKAKQLATQGVEVVKADMNDTESLKKAVEGAYGVFLVTTFDPSHKEQELQEGKNVVDAVKQAAVQHLVFSGAFNCHDVIGKTAANIDNKADIGKYITEQGVPSTVVRIAFYYENLLSTLKPQKNDDHDYVLGIPVSDKPLDMICVSESGECVHQIFVNPDDYKGQSIGLAAQRFTVEEYAAIMSKAFDTKKFVAGNITTEEFGKLELPGAEDYAVMFEYMQSGNLDFDIELTRKLNPAMPTFEQWVDNHRDAFDAALQ